MQSKSRTQVTAGFGRSQVSGHRVLGSHVTSSLQGAPFSKNCTMVSLFKSGLRGLCQRSQDNHVWHHKTRSLTYSDHSGQSEASRMLSTSCLLGVDKSCNLFFDAWTNGKQIRGWKVRKARKAFQAIPALPLRVFRQGHRTSARDCEELKFWSHSNHQSHLEVTWKSKYLCHLALFLELLTLPKRKNWSTKAPPKRSNCPGRTTEKATIQTGCNCTA